MSILYNGKNYDYDGDVYSGSKPVFKRQRRGIPIRYWRHWYRSAVENKNSNSVSVAVRHNHTDSEKAFVAYVSGDVLTVKSAVVTDRAEGMQWQTELTIGGCTSCSLSFDGVFEFGDKFIRFTTESLPWLFYTTNSGELKGGKLNGSFQTIVGSGVTAIDSVRGIHSRTKDNDQGLLVFYVISGGVFCRSVINGVWSDQQTVTIAPANAVNITADRTFDWRIVLQVQDNTGALHEVFSRPYYSGWINVEFLTAKVTDMTVSVTEINYADYKNADEYITASASDMEVWAKSISSPYMVSAWNIPTSMYDEETEEYYDDYGYYVVLKWSDAVFDFDANLDKFTMTDDYSAVWHPQEIVRDELHNRLILRFNNFNNATNPITLSYSGGTLSSGVVAVEATSVEFDAVGLVPTFVPAPEFVSAWNDGNQTIYVEFDRPILNVVSQDGITVSADEPYYSPDGELIETEYGFDSVDHVDALTVYTDGLNGSMADVENVDGVIQLEVDA